jgi:hypothetical protein
MLEDLVSAEIFLLLILLNNNILQIIKIIFYTFFVFHIQ